MPTTAYDAYARRCPRATVGAPDDDLLDQTITEPALNHKKCTPVAHSWPKETSHSYAQLEGFDEAATAKYVHFFIQTP
jgi:hypothetical protein